MEDGTLAALAALEEMGIQLPEGVEIATFIRTLGKGLASAKKALPKVKPVRFEERGEGSEIEVVLRVQRGGRGQPLVVNQHAAILLCEQLFALRVFAESGEVCELESQDEAEEGDEA